MSDDLEKSLGDAATFAGKAKRPPSSEMSLGDERTLGDRLGDQDTVIDDIEVVDLEARYRVEGTLGQGGMGAVLLATDTRLDRKVAIKRILGEAAGNRMAVQRFLTEAKAIAALNHPNIVQIYDYGRAKEGPFLIMEYVDGGSLLERCRESALPLDEAIDLACQLCDGLAKAHDLGIIHRDIKPANVLLTKDGTPKLTDFGLAKAEAGDHGQTMTGAILGTPDFMPPEQRRDASEVDARSDLWSLAATVYQMVTGRSPKIMRFDLLPAEVMKVLGKALEDAKSDRFQTAREFRDALLVAVSSQGRPVVAGGLQAMDGVLQEGQCKACGTVTSDLTRKFCRNPQCGASLRAACLKCNAQIPVWDSICGECSGNQPVLLESKRKLLEATRAEAESLLAELAFDGAMSRAEEIAAESHVELADIAQWAKAFVSSTRAERDRQHTVATEHLQDAIKHARACDYPAAISALKAIPEPLRGGREEVSALLEQCRGHQEESSRLISEIAQRITRKEIDGLLPQVERAAQLRGDRADLLKIRQQLTERRDARLSRARAAMESGDVQAASKELAGAAGEDLGEEAQLLHRVTRAAAAEERLLAIVREAKADGVVSGDEARTIVEAGEEYLSLNPASEKAKLLVEQAREIADRHARRLQEAEARRLQDAEARRRVTRALTGEASAAETLALPPVRNSIGIELKLLPAGTFTMGQASGDSDETPHQVTLTKPFYIGVHEVTNAQWKRVMGNEPSNWKDADRPVERVSWEDAVEFCRKLSELPEERKAGRVYRLPTEAEWEYACRAGTDTKYSFGDDESKLGEYGWFDGNSDQETHPVGKKKPNAWGLYDMHGNIWEWCSDWYGEYPNRAVTDPQGPSGASDRVSRGGCWYYPAGYCRSADRGRYDPSIRNFCLGFRLALSSSGVQPGPPEAAVKK
ncbi:MAG: SUMF1/EgtB/PvdO family nonheme iron enzyme [Planctomycetia bacterium]